MEEYFLAIWHFPDDFLLLKVEDVEVLGEAVELFAYGLHLSLLVVAKVVLEKRSILKGLNVLLIVAEGDELMRQILQVNDHEDFLPIEGANVEKALAIMADTEFLVIGQRRNAQGRVLKASISHIFATCAPYRNAAIVIRLQLVVVLALHLEFCGSELNRLSFTEHITGVLSVTVSLGVIVAMTGPCSFGFRSIGLFLGAVITLIAVL